MAFSDRVRAWFKGESRRSSPSPSTGHRSRASTRELEAFAASRVGVEAFVEPRTAIYEVTLLMVATDGEYLRRPIGDAATAKRLCGELNVPLYDAAKVGYPRRMRDWEAGVRRAPVRDEDLPPWPGDDAEATGPPPPPLDEGSDDAAGDEQP